MPHYHFSDARVTRRRRLHGGRVPRLRRARRTSSSRSASTGRSRRRREALPQVRLLRRATERRGRARPRSSGRTSTASATRRPPSSTSAAARTSPRTLTAWLAAKVEAPRSFAKGLKMPSYGFGAEDSQAVVTALLSLGAQPVPEAYRVLPAQPAGADPRGPRRRARGPLPLPLLSPDRRPGRRHLDRAAHVRGKQGPAQTGWSITSCSRTASGRSSTERMPIFHMPREEAVAARRRDRDALRRPAVPEDPFQGRPASDADPVEGERLYTTLGCRACHILGSNGGYYGPPLTDSGGTAEAGLDLHVAQGAAALARRRPLSRLRPDRPGRAATDRVPRDACTSRPRRRRGA